MKQKAISLTANTVSEYVHLAGVRNVLHPLAMAGRTEVLEPDHLLERGRERHP